MRMTALKKRKTNRKKRILKRRRNQSQRKNRTRKAKRKEGQLLRNLNAKINDYV